ncbi:MAG: NfeD family protein [Myxococcota bacterium]
MMISKTFRRYLLLELPGWTLAAVLLWFIVDRWGLALHWAVLLWLGWVAKDFALYPWLRKAYEDGPDAAELLVGREGEALDRLDPGGYVRIGPERWRAELGPDHDAVDAGARVRVRAVHGLTLVVAAVVDERG